VKQGPYSGVTDIRRSRTKFSRLNDLVPGVCSPLHARIMAYVVDEGMSMGHWWNDSERGKNRRTGRKTCHSATLSTTNLDMRLACDQTRACEV